MSKKIIMEYENDVDFHEVVDGLTEQVRQTGVPMSIFKTPNGDVLVKVPKKIEK